MSQVTADGQQPLSKDTTDATIWYDFLWPIFEPLYRGLDLERQCALDGLLDIASRKLASQIAVSIETRLAEVKAIDGDGKYRL